MGWRQTIDDARRLQFVFLLVAGVITATWAGTSWGWWSGMWDLTMPVRVVGVIAMSATVFVAWYGLLFGSYYYLGHPRRNPLVGPRIESEVNQPNLNLMLLGKWDGNQYAVGVLNRGATDTFAVETNVIFGAPTHPKVPTLMRWQGTDTEKREIVKGHTQELEVCRFERSATWGHINGQFPLTHVWLMTPKTEVDLVGGACEYIDLHLGFMVTSVTTGKSDRFSLHLNVCSTGMVRTSAMLGRDDSSAYSV